MKCDWCGDDLDKLVDAENFVDTPRYEKVRNVGYVKTNSKGEIELKICRFCYQHWNKKGKGGGRSVGGGYKDLQ